MSESVGNEHQNTPSIDDLDAQLLADEAARVEPEVAEVEVKAEPEPQIEAEPEDKPDDEFEKRIARMAYEKRAAEKEARSLRERLERLEGKAPPLSQEEDEDARVERRAAEMAATQTYNAKANAIYKAGIEAFPDFEVKLSGLRDLGGISPQLVEAADEVGDAHKLIHYLARNLDEAERIIGLAPHKMGAALGKIAAKMAPAPRAQSKAPPPIKPLGGSTRADVDDEHMPIDEWMKREDDRWAAQRSR